MKRTLLLLACLMAVMLISPAGAQTTAAAADSDSKDLARSATFLKTKFKVLLTEMDKIAQLMESTEPDVAKILRQTVVHAQQELVSEKMGNVVDALQRGLDSAAKESHSEVVGNLKHMLRILEGGVKELSDTDKKLAEYRAARAQIDKLAKEQADAEEKSRAIADAKEIDKATAKVLRDLGELVKAQTKLVETVAKIDAENPALRLLGELRDAIRACRKKQDLLLTGAELAGIDKLPLVGEAQKRLTEPAATLITQIDKAAKDATLLAAIQKAKADEKTLAKASASVASASGEMKRAAAALVKSDRRGARRPQEQSAYDLKQAEDVITAAMKKIAAGTASGESANKQKDLAAKARALDKEIKDAAAKAGIDPEDPKGSGDKPAGKAGEKPVGKAGEKPAGKAGEKPSGDMDKAAKHMDKAAENMNAQKLPPAQSEQKKALAELKRKLEKVKDLREKALDAARKALDKKQQDRIAADAKKLAERMKKGQDGAPMPGQSSMGKASKSSKAAAGEMSESSGAKSANQSQKDALDEMKKAQEELDERIAELERRSKAEKLAKIEARLDAVLTEQRQITKQTKEVYRRRSSQKPHYDREAAQQLSGLSKAEGGLAEEIESVRKMLGKEGTTVVFPDILGDVKSDLELVQKQLGERKAGVITQATQEEIERTLDELVRSVREELSKGPGRKKGGGGGPGGGGGKPKKPPLIPPLAELKMLRLQQLRVNQGTRRLNKDIEAKVITADQAKPRQKTLSERQSRVVDLSGKIKKKLKAGQR